MNCTATTNWGYQAAFGTAARFDAWPATGKARGAHHHALAIAEMPSVLVKSTANGIRHRPSEVST